MVDLVVDLLISHYIAFQRLHKTPSSIKSGYKSSKN